MDILKNKTVTVGFDGFIDTIVTPIKQSSKQGNEYFDNIQSFGEFIASKSNVSCSIELKTNNRAFGGNMPHLAYSLAKKGGNVNAIGMLGQDGITKEFKPLEELCTLYSYANEATATAMEFDDGKIFLSSTIDMDEDPYEKITEIFDIQKFLSSDVFALVNWSEIEFSHKLWQDIYENVFQNAQQDKSKFVFFDLCDCGRKSGEEIKSVLGLIALYNSKRTAILSLNENEANIIAKEYSLDAICPKSLAKSLRNALNIDEIVIHTTKRSTISTKNGEVSLDTTFIDKPKISTGSGDNFNASYIFAKLLEVADEKCLEIANYGAYFYVKNGRCATSHDMKTIL